ncbi:MAG: hypothetical protein IKP67_05280, partial [Spirochaetales bacterium]|nr:hypothetical protein [Spirochaetales bacterium]
VAFYTDNENYLKCKNVNNVVEVDLDSFSLGNNQSTDAGFKSDIDGIDVETGDTYYWRIELD